MRSYEGAVLQAAAKLHAQRLRSLPRGLIGTSARMMSLSTMLACGVQSTEAMVRSYVEGVSQVAGPPPTRRGCAAVLGVLPRQLLLPRAELVLDALAAGMRVRCRLCSGRMPICSSCAAALGVLSRQLLRQAPRWS